MKYVIFINLYYLSILYPTEMLSLTDPPAKIGYLWPYLQTYENNSYFSIELPSRFPRSKSFFRFVVTPTHIS